jgi:hypothetical protein
MYNDLGHAMRYNDLVAMLHAAKAELAVLASYAEDPATQWPNLGLKTTAQAHKKLRDQIAALLATDPVAVSLREENLALRAALRSCQSTEDWRAKYVEAERERVRLQIRVGRLEWLAEAGCENTPTKGCECPGCMTARERAERGEA